MGTLLLEITYSALLREIKKIQEGMSIRQYFFGRPEEDLEVWLSRRVSDQTPANLQRSDITMFLIRFA